VCPAIQWQGFWGSHPRVRRFQDTSGRYPAAWPEVPATKYGAATGASCRERGRQGPMHGTCELAPCQGTDTYLCGSRGKSLTATDTQLQRPPPLSCGIWSVASWGSSVWCPADSGDLGDLGELGAVSLSLCGPLETRRLPRWGMGRAIWRPFAPSALHLLSRISIPVCSQSRQCPQRGAWLSRLWREPFKTECQYAVDCQPCRPRVQHSIATTSVVSFTSCCGEGGERELEGWETDQTPRPLLARHPQTAREGKFSPPRSRYLGILPTLQQLSLALKQQGCFGLPTAQPTAFPCVSCLSALSCWLAVCRVHATPRTTLSSDWATILACAFPGSLPGARRAAVKIPLSSQILINLDQGLRLEVREEALWRACDGRPDMERSQCIQRITTRYNCPVSASSRPC
jgi:hypothetical protein